jgi:hypothetical protein
MLIEAMAMARRIKGHWKWRRGIEITIMEDIVLSGV